MIQGQFLLYEDVRTKRGRTDIITLQPKIHLLNPKTDKFVEQKLILNYRNYDFFEIGL